MGIATINPTIAVTEREFEPDSPEQIEGTLAAGTAAVGLARAASFAQRIARVNTAAGILEAEFEQLGRVLTAGTGEPLASARADVLNRAKGVQL